MIEHGAAVFGGDGYSSDWHEAAVAERGLRNLPTSADALTVFTEPDVVQLFASTGVLSPKELESRYEVYAEQYINSIAVEAKLVADLAKTVIYPAALGYVSELAATITAAAKLGAELGTDAVSLRSARGHGAPRRGGRARDGAGGARLRDRGRAHGALRLHDPPAHGQGARARGRSGAPGCRQRLAAAKVPRDAVHPLTVMC
ncbi:hypothetical protein [Salana multivorans]